MKKMETLAQLIGQIESGNNPHAIRYEKNWSYFSPDITKACQVYHKCTEDTARMILSCSFGKYQLMGQVIYEQGYRGNILIEYMNRDMQQDISFDAFVRSRDIRFSLDQLCIKSARDYFARRYNGPGNVDEYSARIAAVLMANDYKVT